jgi:hypothetical protein
VANSLAPCLPPYPYGASDVSPFGRRARDPDVPLGFAPEPAVEAQSALPVARAAAVGRIDLAFGILMHIPRGGKPAGHDTTGWYAITY